MSGKSKEEKQIKAVLEAAVETVDDGDMGVFINPLTDFGFKRIFGVEANKDLLIGFLNAVLKIRGGIRDLTYTQSRKKRAYKDRQVSLF